MGRKDQRSLASPLRNGKKVQRASRLASGFGGAHNRVARGCGEEDIAARATVNLDADTVKEIYPGARGFFVVIFDKVEDRNKIFCTSPWSWEEKGETNSAAQTLEIGIGKKDKQFSESSPPNPGRVAKTNRQEVLNPKARTGTGSSSRSEDTINDEVLSMGQWQEVRRKKERKVPKKTLSNPGSE
ncbi:hypothetical protein SUGI_1048040 [Cryptomeria japonica]|nr:hypothetical protein SUGI_1048040 [Cryptomeria japonica]